jgi:parvulin-like peptidyl-prolyl isomerase
MMLGLAFSPEARCRTAVARKRKNAMRLTSFIATVTFLFLAVLPSFGQQAEDATDEGAIVSQMDPTEQPPAPQQPVASNPAVLRVNGEPIYAIEISMVMQTIQGQLQERGEEVDQKELARVATQRAIEQKLLVQEARRFGVKPDELEVARAAQLAEERSGGRAVLEAKLKNSGSNYEQFLDVLREIEIMKLFVGNQIQPNVVVTDEEIAEYYEANPTAFDAEERAHAYHMIFVVGEDGEAEAIEATRRKAEAARARCLTGEEDFTSIARELSEGPSAPNGGDLGWVNRGQLVSPLSEAIFALQPGDISPVVQTRFGFHVATITDRRPAERISLEEASPQIEAFLGQQKTADTVGQLLERLLDTAKVDNLLGGSSVGPALD